MGSLIVRLGQWYGQPDCEVRTVIWAVYSGPVGRALER